VIEMAAASCKGTEFAAAFLERSDNRAVCEAAQRALSRWPRIADFRSVRRAADRLRVATPISEGIDASS
jgi:hypothetical protein